MVIAFIAVQSDTKMANYEKVEDRSELSSAVESLSTATSCRDS